jgi:aspartate racemase
MAAMEGNFLGVIGGMGPLATDVFYRMVIDNTMANCDQDHIDMMILSHSSIPDRTASIKSGNTAEVINKLCGDAVFLEKAGARCIAIPCNTSHSFLPEIEAAVNIPVINMISEAAKVAADHCGGPGAKVGVMGTDGTIKMGLYQKALETEGLTPVVPSEQNQKRVMSIIYDCVKAGQPVDPLDFEKIEAEFISEGCECAVLGCTELSSYRVIEGLSKYFVDAMEAAARAAIVECGKELKQI